jgi:hypothetical protein
LNFEKAYQSIRHFLLDFAVEEYKKVIKDELKELNSELKNLKNLENS